MMTDGMTKGVGIKAGLKSIWSLPWLKHSHGVGMVSKKMRRETSYRIDDVYMVPGCTRPHFMYSERYSAS